MAQDRNVQLTGLDQYIPHEICVVHIVPVIRQSYGSRLFQRVGIGGLLPAEPFGQGGDGEDLDPGALVGPVQHILDLLGAVHCGAGVGHAGHGGDAATGGRVGAGDDILLIGEAGVPEVDMHIHQARGDGQTGGVDDLVSLCLQAALNQDDLSVLNQDILKYDGGGHRVDHPPVFD